MSEKGSIRGTVEGRFGSIRRWKGIFLVYFIKPINDIVNGFGTGLLAVCPGPLTLSSITEMINNIKIKFCSETGTALDGC